jgi:RHS repeat-associated protein
MANMGPSFGRVVTVGAEGDIRWADQPVTDWEWTQALAQPLPMRTTAPSSPYAAGDEGALMFAVGSGVGFCLHSTINETLRGITDPNTTDDIYLAGDAGNGYVLSGDIAIELGLPTTLPLNDVLAFDDKVYMAANNGTILYQNAGGPWTVLPYNSGNIRGLAESGFGQVVAVGDHALVHRLSGTTRMAVQDVFPPALADVSMTEGGNGYVVGQDGFARYTANGGQTWSVVATNDPITGDFNAVRTKAQGDAIAVGSGGLAVHLQATVMTAIEEFGTHDLNAVAIAANGSAVIAGTNSGGHGVCYTLNAGDLILDDWVLHDASAISNLSGKAQHAAWAFQRTILTTGTPVNSFLIAGQAGSSTLLRFDDDGNYASATPITGVPSAGDITALYFHDQVAGYAGTNTGQLLRANTAVDHGSFAWGTSSLPTADGLNDQTNSSLIHIRTISFGSRHKGFLGGVYDDPAYLNYARIITDESGLYSQRLWYDKLGRVVLSQNTKQFNADPKQYSFTFYDELGRVFVAGQMADATGTARNIFGTDVQGAQQPFTIDQENLGIWLDSQLALDPYNLTEMVWTIYDEPGPDVGPFFTTGVQENLRLRVSYTMHAAQGFDIDHASAYSYDIHGNVKELVQYHPQLGVDGDANINAAYKHLKYTYDLISGNVKQVSYQGGQPDQFHHRYRYDADNRIERVETSRNGLTWREDARYFYYPHGPLQRVEIGDAKVQGVDYAYTLQGWLKGINSTLLLPENDMGQDAAYELSGNPNALIGRDVYGLSLGYYGDNDYAAIDETRWDNSTGKRPFAPMGTDGTLHTEHRPLYNGNINHTVNSLAPFGGYPDDPVAPGQVLAMVYKYDQLNRLKEAQGISQITTANTWHEVVDMDDQTIPEPILNKYKSEYWYDANGNIDTLARFDADGNQYDGFKYGYHVDGNGNKVRNRLYNIQEWIDDPYAPDIPHIPHQPDPMADAQNEGAPGYTIQDLNLYEYDAIGQRIRDKVRQITHIEWSTTGKMREVQVAPSSGKQGAAFTYDAGGNRIIKEIRDDAGTPLWREHYVRDAHGNIMAIYRAEEVEEELSLKVTDRPIYGSSRLGVDAHTLELGGLTFEDPNPYLLDNPIGLVKYELTDHLGNVAAVITDELLGVNVDGGPENEYFQPNLISASLYEPFGMNLTGTNWQSDVARFGFQGQLHDLELGFVHFKYREYDPSGSGFLTIDPLAADYPWNSPFAFSENRVIDGIDLEGLEHYSNKYLLSKTSEGKLQIEIISEAKQSYPGKNGWGVDARFYAKDDAGKMQEIPEFRIFIPQPKPFFHCNWSEGGPVFINGKELSFTASRAFEGKHGYDNGGRDAMLGTFSLVLGGASLYAGSVSPVWGIVGMVDSADELTGNEDGTLIERAFGEWGGRAKTAINIASLSTGLYKLINGNADPKRMKDAAETFFIDLSNVVKDTFDLLITPEPPKE